MSVLLLTDRELADRRRVVLSPGSPLAGLAASLAADLAPVLARPVWLPPNKARLTRVGGTCPRDGVRLTFDPFAPHAHRCPTCGHVCDRDEDYQWWTFGYQLWLAERAVHAATVAVVTGVEPLSGATPMIEFVARVLDAQADAYLRYPNADNVLGPTRPFFSTYLESLWLVHVCTALDLLRSAAPGVYDALAARVCDRIIEPSRALIAGYPEGTSNRQVWHAVARLAAARVLGDGSAAEDAVHGPSGIADLLRTALLADGSWYEGDNYHQFAHRGFWYGVRIAERAGIVLAPALIERFRAGYAVPLRVALPDETLPARRDSQYAVSLRQWRWAEWCELGLTDGAGPQLRTALANLYRATDPPLPHATGRWRTTGESERNEPASALSRADLGWKSLLLALPEHAPADGGAPPRAVLLPAQGYAVLRRDAGRVYAALDFGGGGGGHGHPDRLNVTVQDGEARWLDDPGTGTYVERTLHWYRSTLAHAAPLVDGRSQPRGQGQLEGFDPGPDEPDPVERSIPRVAGVAARAGIDGIAALRALVATDAYVIDRFTWRAVRRCVVDLPFHVDGTVAGSAWRWAPFALRGAGGLEDGFDFARHAEAVVPGSESICLTLGRRGATDRPTAALWLVSPGMTLWRAIAPGPPGLAERRFHAVRMHGARGAVVAVWDLRGTVDRVAADHDAIALTFVDGTVDRHAIPPRWGTVAAATATGSSRIHPSARADGREWCVQRTHTDGTRDERRLTLAQSNVPRRPRARDRAPAEPLLPPGTGATYALPDDGTALTFLLGLHQYVRSEPSWDDAGAPAATVRIFLTDAALTVDVDVRLGRAPAFAAAGSENPLDNERADVNSDGLQLLIGSVTAAERAAVWLLVPEMPAPRVRVTPTVGDLAHAGRADALDARWEPWPDGWRIRCTLARDAIDADILALDLAVNEKPPERDRRRGQLVLGEPDSPFVYLRGDRMSAARALRFVLPPSARPGP